MAGKSQPVRPPPNVVHQNAILVETVRKEERHQVLFESYSPKKNITCVTGKLNVASDSPADLTTTSLDATTSGEVKPRGILPKTSAQEYGWYNSMATADPNGPLNKGRHQTEITNYMDAFWKQKEQASLGGKGAAAEKK